MRFKTTIPRYLTFYVYPYNDGSYKMRLTKYPIPMRNQGGEIRFSVPIDRIMKRISEPHF